MTGHITQANQRMAEMFLYPLEELLQNKEYVELIHPSEKEIGRQKMLALLESKITSVDLERIYCRADGSSFWGRLTGKRFYNTKGEEIGLVGVIADIDDRQYITPFYHFTCYDWRHRIDSSSPYWVQHRSL